MEELTYDEFIQNILDTRDRFGCGDEYHERHHIKPTCMGGTNDKDNLIDLFAKEHFIAHRLLALENPDNDKLTYAWHMMAVVKDKNQDRYELTPEEYEEVKIACAKMQSETRKGKNHPNYGKHMSEETKEKLRIANTNPSEETRRKMGETKKKIFLGEGNPFYGKKHSDETKNKISDKLREYFSNPENHPFYGKHLTEEHKEKIRISHLKENLSVETLEKMRLSHPDMHGENNPMFGKHHSKETRQKIGDANKKGKIIQLTKEGLFIREWDHLMDIEKEFGFSHSNIAQCCRGTYKYAYGFDWMYKEEYEQQLQIN